MPKILLVEDNEMNRDMLSRRLERRGYEVVIAVDGQQGVDLAQSTRPDLILMDMSLPVIDGWEATRQLKAKDAVKATPQVLDSPPPSVFFIGFGASALEFEVRAFVLQLAHRSTVINDLHVAIERALREKEIAMS